MMICFNSFCMAFIWFNVGPKLCSFSKKGKQKWAGRWNWGVRGELSYVVCTHTQWCWLTAATHSPVLCIDKASIVTLYNNEPPIYEANQSFSSHSYPSVIRSNACMLWYLKGLFRRKIMETCTLSAPLISNIASGLKDASFLNNRNQLENLHCLAKCLASDESQL